MLHHGSPTTIYVITGSMEQSSIVGSYLSLPFKHSSVNTGGFQFVVAPQSKYIAKVSFGFHGF